MRGTAEQYILRLFTLSSSFPKETQPLMHKAAESSLFRGGRGGQAWNSVSNDQPRDRTEGSTHPLLWLCGKTECWITQWFNTVEILNWQWPSKINSLIIRITHDIYAVFHQIISCVCSARTSMTRNIWPGWLLTMCGIWSAFPMSPQCRTSSALCTATQLPVVSSSRPSSLAVTTSPLWDYILSVSIIPD